MSSKWHHFSFKTRFEKFAGKTNDESGCHRTSFLYKWKTAWKNERESAEGNIEERITAALWQRLLWDYTWSTFNMRTNTFAPHVMIPILIFFLCAYIVFTRCRTETAHMSNKALVLETEVNKTLNGFMWAQKKFVTCCEGESDLCVYKSVDIWYTDLFTKKLKRISEYELLICNFFTVYMFKHISDLLLVT